MVRRSIKRRNTRQRITKSKRNTIRGGDTRLHVKMQDPEFRKWFKRRLEQIIDSEGKEKKEERINRMNTFFRDANSTSYTVKDLLRKSNDFNPTPLLYFANTWDTAWRHFEIASKIKEYDWYSYNSKTKALQFLKQIADGPTINADNWSIKKSVSDSVVETKKTT
jgi:hypothetical protein